MITKQNLAFGEFCLAVCRGELGFIHRCSSKSGIKSGGFITILTNKIFASSMYPWWELIWNMLPQFGTLTCKKTSICLKTQQFACSMCTNCNYQHLPNAGCTRGSATRIIIVHGLLYSAPICSGMLTLIPSLLGIANISGKVGRLLSASGSRMSSVTRCNSEPDYHLLPEY